MVSRPEEHTFANNQMIGKIILYILFLQCLYASVILTSIILLILGRFNGNSDCCIGCTLQVFKFICVCVCLLLLLITDLH